MPVDSPKLTLFQGRVHIGYRGDGKRDPVKGVVCEDGCFLTVETGSPGSRRLWMQGIWDPPGN